MIGHCLITGSYFVPSSVALEDNSYYDDQPCFLVFDAGSYRLGLATSDASRSGLCYFGFKHGSLKTGKVDAFVGVQSNKLEPGLLPFVLSEK